MHGRSRPALVFGLIYFFLIAVVVFSEGVRMKVKSATDGRDLGCCMLNGI